MIEIKNLSYSVKGKDILKGLNFSIPMNQMTQIIGPNGAGKSTLIKIIIGFMTPSAGIVQHHINENLVSYLPQKYERSEDLCLDDYLRLSGFKATRGLPSRYNEFKKKIESLKECLRLVQSHDTMISTLSGGEFQKWRLLGATYWNPDLILLDEPTSFLDPKYQDEIQLLFDYLIEQEKKTIISVTHDLNKVLNSKGHVVALKNGELYFQGQTSELFVEDVINKLFDKKFKLKNIDGGLYAL
ncbi:MAG: ABC transporter ATP-binding protein [Bdellovibrio sp.]